MIVYQLVIYFCVKIFSCTLDFLPIFMANKNCLQSL